MDFNSAMERALAQARELQKQVSAAASDAAEQMKPHLEQSLEKAKELQATLGKHATESGEIAAKSTETARAHLNDFIRMGGDAMRESAEQTRQTALKMVEESRKIVEAASEAISKKPE